MTDQQPPETPVIVKWPVSRVRVVIESSQRPCEVAVPPDLTDAELLELAAWMLNPVGLRLQLDGRSNVITPPQFSRPT